MEIIEAQNQTCLKLFITWTLIFFSSGLRKHDVAFLLTVRPQVPIGYRYKHGTDFVTQVGLVCVRGCEIEGLLDDTGKVIEEGQ